MTQNTNPTVITDLDALATGRSSSAAFVTVYETRNPTAQDVNYPIQKRWVNLSNNIEWILISYTNASGQLQANWVSLGMASTQTLTGNSGGAVSVDGSNNINVVGDGTTIDVVGDPSTHTLTISAIGEVPLTFDCNVDSATASGGVINVVGSGGVITTGSGDTVTITYTPTGFVETLEGNSGGMVPPTSGGNILVEGDGTTIEVVGTIADNKLVISAGSEVATTYQEDSGTATPSSNVLIIAGGTGIATSGSGNTVTITNTSASSLTFDEDSGSATPSAGIIMIRGGTGISTSGSGNTVTISSSSGSAITKVVNQVFTTSGTYTPSAGMVYAQITILGGGGGGSGAASTPGSNLAIGGGGGAGEYAVGIFTAASIGVSQTVTIGSGGAGGTGATGSPGGTTNVGTLITSGGGAPGTGSLSATTGTIDLGGIGGTGGSGGDYRTPGFPGGAGFTIPGIGGYITMSGQGASSQLGSGGNNVFQTNPGNNALGYGAGGSGGCNLAGNSANVGGNGTPGIVIITEYVS